MTFTVTITITRWHFRDKPIKKMKTSAFLCSNLIHVFFSFCHHNIFIIIYTLCFIFAPGWFLFLLWIFLLQCGISSLFFVCHFFYVVCICALQRSCTLRFLCQRNFYVLFLQWKTLNWVCRKWWINQSTQQWWTKNKVNMMRNAEIKEKHERRKWTTEERGHSRFNGRLFVYMVLLPMNAYIVFMHLNSKWWGIFCFNFCQHRILCLLNDDLFVLHFLGLFVAIIELDSLTKHKMNTSGHCKTLKSFQIVFSFVWSVCFSNASNWTWTFERSSCELMSIIINIIMA